MHLGFELIEYNNPWTYVLKDNNDTYKFNFCNFKYKNINSKYVNYYINDKYMNYFTDTDILYTFLTLKFNYIIRKNKIKKLLNNG